MKATARPRNVGGSHNSRARHGARLSITDNNHHVTEAIGDMYGDDEYQTGGASTTRQDARPLSFIASPLGESVEVASYFEQPATNASGQLSPTRLAHSQRSSTLPIGMPSSQRSPGFEAGQISPTLSLREHAQAELASQKFPLNDIDYQSNPTDIQQEMHNLQALRRMSMDVANNNDPDLPFLASGSMVPAVAPTGDDREDDPSRLFWVPARVHPELAPMEFKTFLENRVQSMKRRSGDTSNMTLFDGLERSHSGSGGLARKKSMLSRQIDNSGGRGAIGYKDGAEQLERKKSLSGHLLPEINLTELKKLDHLVRDPSNSMNMLTLDSSSRDSGIEVMDDAPILPTAPGAMGLKRSTHSNYRRGSMRKGERIPYSQRARQRAQDTEGDDVASPSSPIGLPLVKISSAPAESTSDNFSRPDRRRGVHAISPSTSPISPSFPAGLNEENEHTRAAMGETSSSEVPPSTPIRHASFPQSDVPIPRIVEMPPPRSDEQPQQPRNHSPVPTGSGAVAFPERSSSQTSTKPSHPQAQASASPVQSGVPLRSARRPQLTRETSSAPNVHNMAPSSPSSSLNTLNDLAQKPSPLMAHNSRTDTLTFIPTLNEAPKDRRSKEDEDGPKKTSWGWFKGSEKDKKGKKDEERDGKKAKKSMSSEKGDVARLDVLQQSIDPNVRGRESLVLDRDSLDGRLQAERSKESARKAGEGKKEKDSLFSSLFGGSRKKSGEATTKKASSLRALSPDPPHAARLLKPDIDYNWTRFSLLEERAIYRMAHIKLANPRRALYSQVLLSNFMYSYLAKVQQQHPNMQIPQSAVQKKQQAEEKKRREEEEARQRREQEEQYKYDYHSGLADYADEVEQDDEHDSRGAKYVDDAQLYNYDHRDDATRNGHAQHRAQQYAQHGGQHSGQNYGAQIDKDYSYGDQRITDERDNESEMW